MTGFDLGRLQEAEKSQQVLHDAPEKQVAAIMSKLDELIDAMKALGAKLDADGVGGADYAALVTDALKKIELKL